MAFILLNYRFFYICEIPKKDYLTPEKLSVQYIFDRVWFICNKIIIHD